MIFIWILSIYGLRTTSSSAFDPQSDINPIVTANLPETCGGTFPAVADALVYSDDPDTNYGTGDLLVVSYGIPWVEQRTFLAFDFVDEIPAGSQILKAELELTIHEAGSPFPYQFEIYSLELEEDFTESSVTWNTQPVSGDRYDAYSSDKEDGILYIDVTALAIGWIQGSIPQAVALIPAREMSLSFYSQESDYDPLLVIQCAPPSEPIPQDQSTRDQEQQVGLERLQQNSEVPATIEFGVEGSLRFAGFEIPIPASVGSDRLNQSLWFMDAYRDALRLDNPDQELQLTRRSESGDDLFFRQRVNGIPVFPSELAVHIREQTIIGINGNYVPDLELASEPSLSAQTAEQLALITAEEGGMIRGITQLSFIDMRLLGHEEETTRLAWKVHVGDSAIDGMYFIDAHNGEVILLLPDTVEAYDLELSTANHKRVIDWDTTDDDDQWYDENGLFALPPDPVPPTPDAEGDTANTHSKTIYDYYANTFGRDSFDGHGQLIRHFVHVGINFRNAYYSSPFDIFAYGDGYPVLDTMAHEFTHGVTQKTSNLVYESQSGALNESFSDIFAHFIDPEDWLQGEDKYNGASRSMSNPPAFGDPDKMSDYLITYGDWGGVHTNSGIHNKVAYLMVDGDTFNGWTVAGIGESKAQRLFYTMLTTYLTKNSAFIDARNEAVWLAKFFTSRGLYSFTSNDVCQVKNAYAAVELGRGDSNCDGVEEGNPLDGDGDGMPYDLDNCPTIANPNQRDLDMDKIGDACDPDIDNDGVLNDPDNCPYARNPDQEDTNHNTIGDACEDLDGDGRLGYRDNCPNIPNPLQEDMDTDLIGDVCDDDRDGDLVDNDVDNCPDKFNGPSADNQANQDGDQYGNACDLCPKLSSSDNNDADKDGLGDPCDPDDDNDGVPDSTDNCPIIPNPDQYDGNSNGLGYECDLDEQIKLIDGTTGWGILHFPAVQYQYPWSISLPICSSCRLEYLPRGYHVVIHIDIPTDYRARISDSEGMSVTTSGRSIGALDLTFFPVPHAGNRVGAPMSANSFHNVSSLGSDQVSYRLEIYPSEGTDPEVSYPISLQLETIGYYQQIYLPIIVH